LQKETFMTSFSFLPLATAGPSTGLVALDFGPAVLVVGAVLLVIATALALAAPAPLAATPSPPPRRSTASVHVRRLGRSLGRRPERGTLASTIAGPRTV
jgi:hypothetical protein